MDENQLIVKGSITPSYDIVFHNESGEIGRLDFNGPSMVFTGNADESAKALFDYVARLFANRLKSSPDEASGEAMTLLRDYYAAYPHGRLGERARALLGAPYPTVPCNATSGEAGPKGDPRE